ncbi:MAG: hypothetical protein M1820_009042 [Bogoriella megaspora]|nr:MAG: hypothetical protein M1820_009042 [Bogoriella megaspora]
MDKLKNALGGSSSGSSNQSGGGQNEDYADKGLDSVEKKAGVTDTSKLRSANEKITDTARTQFEKLTGKDVPDKVSN